MKTSLGEDAIPIRPQSYLVVSDTHANEIRFFRTTLDESQALFEEECAAITLERAGLHAFSGSGAFLYAVPAGRDSSSDTAEDRELTVVHMGAQRHPRTVGTIPYVSVDGPTALAVDRAGEHLVLLTQTELLVFNIRDEENPRLLSQLCLSAEEISPGGYAHMALMDGGNKAVLLDALANRLTVVDLSCKQAPHIASQLDVLSDEVPRLIDLVADRADDRVLHVIAGHNLRLAKEMFHRFALKLQDMAHSEEAQPGRLIRYRLDGDVLEQIAESHLPDGTIPLHVLSGADGEALVSAVDLAVTGLETPDSVIDGVGTVFRVVVDAFHLGSVFRIDQDGGVTKAARGISMFLTMASLPGSDELVVLTMRAKVRKFPPSVGVKLSLDTLDHQGLRRCEQLLRTLSWSFLRPPYNTPEISFQ